MRHSRMHHHRVHHSGMHHSPMHVSSARAAARMASLCLPLSLALALPAPAAASPSQPAGRDTAPANLLANGGFEAGNLSGWTQSGNTEYTQALAQSYGGYTPHTGSFYALLGPVGSDGTLSQAFTDIAGQTLTFTFYLAADGATPSDFAASFDGATLMALANAPAQSWTEYTFSLTATGQDSIAFSFRNDPAYWALDDASVTAQPAAIPEPAAAALLATGLAGLALTRRRLTRR